jgi:hypothetical protein
LPTDWGEWDTDGDGFGRELDERSLAIEAHRDRYVFRHSKASDA